MAKKQTRRNISISGATGNLLEAYCEAQGIAKSALVEYLLANPGAPPRDLDALHRWNDERIERLNRERALLSEEANARRVPWRR